MCFGSNLDKEQANEGKKASESKVVKLNGVSPPIKVMDSSLSMLTSVE